MRPGTLTHHTGRVLSIIDGADCLIETHGGEKYIAHYAHMYEEPRPGERVAFTVEHGSTQFGSYSAWISGD